MRHATFEVPSEIIGDFTEKLTELELDNTIAGKTDDGEIIVQVSYEKDEADKIDELEEHLEELIEGIEEEEEEEDEDEK
ncbi:MAG: hypothetical protein H0U95_08090 [Bacteroidetes bacterium]|nr:hypothetical protein [Bacteroidota bacterium]